MVIRAASRASYLMPAGLPLPAFDSRCDNRWADTPGDSVFGDGNEGEFAFRWSSVKWTGWDLNRNPHPTPESLVDIDPLCPTFKTRIRRLASWRSRITRYLPTRSR